jgi:FKBP-type peptidyl-prolyl cis-trans isomerase 2
MIPFQKREKAEIIIGYENLIKGLEKRIEEYREEIRKLKGQETII